MGIGYSIDNSVPLKNNQKIELTFKDIFKTSDKEKLKKLKSHLSESFNTDKLFNSKKFTKDLEAIFVNLIERKTK